MSTRRLERSEWHSYFDALSRHLSGQTVRVEVAGLSLGNQVVAASLPILGITFEPKSDLLEIALDGIDHLIRKPSEIYVQEDGGSLHSMAIVDADGHRQLLQVTEPLRLPAKA